tara:strand:+ start:19 stop:837 length:819 start_codon:yes stop_codon:yes gene_type:complete
MFKSSKKKLIVSGCSYSDNYATREGIANFKVYGQLLAEKLDMELVNVAQCGFGNKAIFTCVTDSMLSDRPKKDIGLVIAQWSEWQRVDGYIEANKPWRSFLPERTILDAQWHEVYFKDTSKKDTLQYEVSSVLHKHGLDSIKGGFKDTLNYMYSFQSICEVNNIPYLQFQGTNLISHKKEPKHSNDHRKLYNLIIDSSYLNRMEKTFLGWPIMGLEFFPKHLKKRTKYFSWESLLEPDERISEEDTHPNGKGHEMMAEKLYDAYKELYINRE